MAESFAVIQGGGEGGSKSKKKPAERGTKAWVQQQCEEGKRLTREVDTAWIVIGKILWDVYDVPVDNNPGGKPSFTLMGYQKLEDFAEAEFGLQQRKAYSLRQVYFRLFHDLKDIDPALRERFLKLGWTKARTLVRVATLKNVESWVKYAEEHTLLEVEKEVTAHLDAARKAKAESEGQTFDSAAAGASFEADPLPSDTPTNSKVIAKKTKGVAEEPDDAGVDPFNGDDLMPSPDETQEFASEGPIFDPSLDLDARKKRFFHMLPDEDSTVQAALDRSAELSGTKDPSKNLALICLEYTASNASIARSKMTEAYRVKMLAAVESLLGIQIVAIDPKKPDTPFYASAGLQKKAAEESGA